MAIVVARETPLQDDVRAMVAALKMHDETFGEVRRIHTAPSIRGTGAGRQILNAIEDEALGSGLQRLRLEPAWRIHERGGFARCSAVADYPDSKHNVFYEKKLTA